MRIKLAVFPVAAVTALTILSAQAGPGKSGGPVKGGVLPADLATFDTDGDGKLSATEREALKAAMEAKKQAFLDKYDTNKDGVLSTEELAVAKADREAAIKAERTAKFASIDTSGDGKITLAELQAANADTAPARLEALFKHLDTNSDASISLDEFLATPKPGSGHAGKPGRR